MPQRLPSVPGRILVAARAQDDDRAVVHYAAELFAFLVVALRLGGKRELAQINVMDLAVLLLASNALQNAMIGNDNLLLGGVLGASVLFAANYVFVRVTYRSERIRRVLEGPPVLVQDGRPDAQTLRREAISVSELRSVARERGLCGSRRGGVDGARDRRAPGGDGAGGRQALARRVAVGTAEIAASCNVHAGLRCQA